MKIAITADLHLTHRERNPERFETFENLLADLRAMEVGTLIIAGDLFDSTQRNYADFERICRREENQGIHIYVIPGNHDPGINSQDIVGDNLTIFTFPTLIPDFGDIAFGFIPFQHGITMGDGIAVLDERPPPNQWVLVGHGDLVHGPRIPNPFEPGVYMPLGSQNVQAFQPRKVFLGHIHISWEDPPVYYTGSPCGLDISETGRRSYLLYDTESDQVERRTLNTPVLYFSASFVVLPAEDEARHLRQQIKEAKERWGVQPDELAKTQIRVSIAGYSSDKSALQVVLDEEFRDFTFYKGEKPNLDQVSTAHDVERQAIVHSTEQLIEAFDWPYGGEQPDKDQVKLAALKIIYGG